MNFLTRSIVYSAARNLAAVALAATTLSLAGAPASAKPAALLAACPEDQPAAVLSHPTPQMSEVAQAWGESGSVVLRIRLDASGELQDVAIKQSSGYAELDREAIRVARESRYAPATAGCAGQGGDYLYQVDFNA
jgi:protein TonB